MTQVGRDLGKKRRESEVVRFNCNNELDYTAQVKWQKKVCVRESTENLEMLSNTGIIQGIRCPYVINYPIL